VESIDDAERALEPLLTPLGFLLARPETWVRARTAVWRDVFQLEQTKGGLAARWGIDLAFVPIRRGRGLRWKRAPKDVAIDLCFDPIDATGLVAAELTFLGSREETVRAASRSVALACADLDPIADLRAFCQAFADRSVMKWERFGPDNYVQTHLAWGLALYALGRDSEAEPHLARYCGAQDIPRSDRTLARAIEEARAGNAT
jgi:hypothetical protein